MADQETRHVKELAAHQAQLTDHTAQIKVGGCRANPHLLHLYFGVLPAGIKRCHDMPRRGDWVSASELHELLPCNQRLRAAI